MRAFAASSRARAALERRYREPTLWDAFLQYLAREGYPVPAAHLTRDVTAPIDPSPEIQDILMDVYRQDAKTRSICERLVDLDEGLQEWRYRHVRMVERTIGVKPGTGGSSRRRLSAHHARAEPVSGSVGDPIAFVEWERENPCCVRRRSSSSRACVTAPAHRARSPVRAEDLPDGEGKKILESRCTSCHELTEVTKFRGYYNRAQWRDIVVTMVEVRR